MYDTSFDHDKARLRRMDPRTLWSLRIAALAATILAASADAQIPGAPVLQNAWASPGIVAAVDLGGGSDGSVYAGAASWAPGSGRFQLSAGAGYQTRTGAGSRGVYGVRGAIPFGGASSTFGFAAFAGFGGGASSKTARVDSVPNTSEFPVGAAVGWRKAIGGSHGLSLYATPSYVFLSGGTKQGGLVRTSVAADFGVTASIGVTLGVEFGQTRPRALGGPSGSLYGLGLSYALGHR